MFMYPNSRATELFACLPACSDTRGWSVIANIQHYALHLYLLLQVSQTLRQDNPVHVPHPNPG